jgi:hypothetical protein
LTEFMHLFQLPALVYGIDGRASALQAIVPDYYRNA